MYIYVYIYTCIHTYIYIHLYTYIYMVVLKFDRPWSVGAEVAVTRGWGG